LRNKLLLILTLLITSPALAQVYKWTDADGRVHFSDTPVHGAEVHRSGSVSSISNPTYNMERFSAEIPYQDDNGSMVINGKVNGINVRFILDTGAALVVIPPEVAKQAGIATEGAPMINLDTANGRVQAPQVSLGSVGIGNLSRSNIRGTVQTVSQTPNTGLLGMSFLSAYRMTVDHQRQLILLEKK